MKRLKRTRVTDDGVHMPAPARLTLAASEASARPKAPSGVPNQTEAYVPGRGAPRVPAANVPPPHVGTAALPYEESRVGEVLHDTYRIERLIAVGGMGAVYEVLHLRLQQKFALKIMDHAIARNGEGYARFRQEAEIAASLDHSGIVQVFDFNTDEQGNPYMVMELVEGETLDDWLATERPSLREVVRFFELLCSALDAAHGAGITHRDLKPSNIMVRMRGRSLSTVKLLDFGISKMRDGAQSMTRTNVVMGTPNYMSPEQARGKANSVDATTDVFALGAILYEMVAGRRAFDGESTPELLHAIVYEDPPRLDTLRKDVPAQLADVAARALAKEQTARYPDVRAFYTALRDSVRQRKVPTQPPQTIVVEKPRGKPVLWLAGWVVSVAVASVGSAAFAWGQGAPISSHEIAARPTAQTPATAAPVEVSSYGSELAAPGSRMLVFGTQLYRADHRGVSYWSDPDAPEQTRPLPSAHAVTAITRTVDGDVLVGQADGTISRWDSELREAKGSERPETAPVLALAAGGGYLAVAFPDGVSLYNAGTKRLLKRFPAPKSGDGGLMPEDIVDLVFTRGASKGLLIAIGDQKLELFDADKRQRRDVLELPARALRAEVVAEGADGPIELDIDVAQGDWVVRRRYRLHMGARPRLEPVSGTKL